ncbi:MAG: ParB/RepB/Spo0J family partition protein [Bacteroidota bacterium]
MSSRKKLAQKSSKLSLPKKAIKDHPADMGNYEDGSFFNVDIHLIQDNPHQPRQFFNQETLDELSESIKHTGVLQPIIIRKDKNGGIFLVAGERRLRAARQAGLEQIPAILTKGRPAEIALIENLQREDLKPIEEAQALAKMVEEYGYTQEQLSLVVGKARTTITQILSLNKLPEEVKRECPRADIPKRILIEIARKETSEEMIELFNQVKEGQLNSDQIRKNVRKRTRSPQRPPVQITIEKIYSLTISLKKLDLKEVEEKEKILLLKEMTKLKSVVDEMMME